MESRFDVSIAAIAKMFSGPVKLDRFSDTEFNDEGGMHRMFGFSICIEAGPHKGNTYICWDNDKRLYIEPVERPAIADLLSTSDEVLAVEGGVLTALAAALSELRFAYAIDPMSRHFSVLVEPERAKD